MFDTSPSAGTCCLISPLAGICFKYCLPHRLVQVCTSLLASNLLSAGVLILSRHCRLFSMGHLASSGWSRLRETVRNSWIGDPNSNPYCLFDHYVRSKSCYRQRCWWSAQVKCIRAGIGGCSVYLCYWWIHVKIRNTYVRGYLTQGREDWSGLIISLWNNLWCNVQEIWFCLPGQIAFLGHLCFVQQ